MISRQRLLVVLSILPLFFSVFSAGPARAELDRFSPVGPTGCGAACWLAVAPSDSRVLYAVTLQRDVFRSDDRGVSWSFAGGMEGDDIFGTIDLAIHPRDPRQVVVQHAFKLQKSLDGGVSWTEVPPSSTFFPKQIAFDADGVLYGLGFSGPSWAAARSRDLGTTWETLLLRNGFSAATALAVHPTRRNTVFAAFTRERFGALLRTIDGGQSWSAAGGPLAKLVVLDISFDPTRPNHVFTFAAREWQFQDSGPFLEHRSTDGGATWRALPALGAPVRAGARGFLYAGRFKSTDGGTTWRSLRGTPPGPVIPDPQAARWLYAQAQETIFQSTDDGATWRGADRGLFATTVLDLVEAPGTPRGLYALTESRVLVRRAGSPWQLRGTIQPLFPAELIPDPVRPALLYLLSATEIFKSNNGGARWDPLRPGPAIDRETEGEPAFLRVNPAAPDHLQLGTQATRVGLFGYQSRDAGRTWFQDDGDDLLFHPRSPAAALFRLGSRLLERSRDGGRTLRELDASDLPKELNTDDIVPDPLDPSTLYIGTEGRGVWSITAG